MNPVEEIKLHIRCEDLPGVRAMGGSTLRLGIQKGKDVIEDVPTDEESVEFVALMEVKRHPKTGFRMLKGPFVQGKPGEEFVYLCWGERVGVGWEQSARAKLLLQPLLEEVQKEEEPRAAYAVTVHLTTDKGGPVCASMKGETVEWKLGNNIDE